MKNKMYIGVGGVARSGKNLFCDIARNILRVKYNKNARIYSLAYHLKKDCEDFIGEKLGLSVWSETTSEKNIFRPMLVWYADVKRKETEGRYWIEKLDKETSTDTDSDIILISDIRYSFYDNDEVQWIKNEKKGTLIHIEKYTYNIPENYRKIQHIQNNITKIYTEPCNDHEMLNDPVLKRKSDMNVEWEDINKSMQMSYTELLNNAYLNTIVSNVLDPIINGKS